MRPFGALVFGRLGDLVGRKHTFLVTIVIMGASTFLVGLLPGYATLGVAAPAALIALRLLQGLALGGEYGGAATFVAEHAPANRRGEYTSWIQTTATMGLFLSLMVILATRTWLGEEAFGAWGWRIPFLVSSVLLGVSVWIRMSMEESPAFAKMKAEGKGSKAPLTEAFGQWRNLRIVLLALLGLTAGQAVVWYTGQFYALFFLTQTLKIDGATANLLIAFALLIATPCFVLFGVLSDRIGRKPIILAGCAIAALTYFPLFHALTQAGNPALARALKEAPVQLVANPAECSFQFNPTGATKFTSSCDIAKQQLANASVNYDSVAGTGTAIVRIGSKELASFDAIDARCEDGQRARSGFQTRVGRRAEGRGLSHDRRSGRDPEDARRADPHDPRHLRDDGLWPDRGDAGRALPHAHPLHRDVVALSHRQRLVRRTAADHGVRDRRADGQHLQRTVVSGDRRGRDDADRALRTARHARTGSRRDLTAAR